MNQKLLQVAVVDDDFDDHFFLTESLKFISEPNFNLTHFYSGTELLNYLATNEKLRSALPDLIILDLDMPKMNGFKYLKILKDDPQTREIPVYVLSTSSDVVSKEECRKLGADEYHVKPASVRGLSKTLQNIISKARDDKKNR